MKAVIMAGGEGTRLRPLTCNIPKPMVPIMNKPVMEHIINLLKHYKIFDIAVTLFYLPSVITDYFGNGESFGVKIIYAVEEKPLGTGGSVLNTGNFINETFIVISGDALTDIDLKKAMEYHKSKKSAATLILKKEPVPLEYGVVITNKEGKISRFLEKPSWGEVFSDTINTGIYILEPAIFKYYNSGDNFDFSRDLFPRLLNDDIPMYGYVADEYWCDIGDLESYKKTHFDIFDEKVKLYGNSSLSFKGINIGENCVISENSKIFPPVYIGSNCSIKENTVLNSYTVVGDNCVIDENSTLKKSILWNMVNLGRNNQCRSTLIGSKVLTKSGVNLFENTVIGENNVLMDNATVKPNVKIWPGKKISENAYVNSSIVWGTKSVRNIFGNRGVSGEINYEITPEFTSLLGAAFGSTLKKNSCVVISCDDSTSSFLIKQSMTAGLLSSGSRVIDIGNVILPISRFAVRFYSASGGLHIYQDTGKKEIVNIEFLNENGGTIDRKTERKIENIFLREDFERCTPEALSCPMYIDNFYIQYIQSYLKLISGIQIIKSKSLKIVLSSSSNLTVKFASLLLESAGCNVKISKNQLDSDSFDSFIQYFSSLVQSENALFGVIISKNGENIILVDSEGSVISRDKYIILSTLISVKYGNEKKVIVPNTASMVIESISGRYGAEIIRSKSSISETINSILNLYEKNDSSMLQYILNFDGIAAAVKIIDILIDNSVTLHSLINEIPEYYLIKSQLPCEFKDMGRIIRLFAESCKDNSDLYEGIKINTKNGWALVLPDNEKPIFNIYAEGLTVEFADELSSTVVEKLENLLQNKKT